MTDNRKDAPRLPSAKPLDEAAIRQVSSIVRGQLIRPQDAPYDEARTVFYGGFDRYPALIVRAKDATERDGDGRMPPTWAKLGAMYG